MIKFLLRGFMQEVYGKAIEKCHAANSVTAAGRRGCSY
jgi:hypothetical protein